MAIRPKKIGGKTLSVGKIKRKQKRRKRRLIEAADQDWQRWDAAADHLGLNFTEFARRSLNAAATTMLPMLKLFREAGE